MLNLIERKHSDTAFMSYSGHDTAPVNKVVTTGTKSEQRWRISNSHEQIEPQLAARRGVCHQKLNSSGNIDILAR